MRHSSIISVLILAVALLEIQSTPLESNLSENDKEALEKVGKGLLNFNKESLLGELIGKESEELSRIIRAPSGTGDSGGSSANANSNSIINVITSYRERLTKSLSNGILGEVIKLVIQILVALSSALFGDVLGSR